MKTLWEVLGEAKKDKPYVVRTGNPEFGFHGNIASNPHDQYKLFHGHVKRLTHEEDDDKVVHFLDSVHGRQIANMVNTTGGEYTDFIRQHIKGRYNLFSKNYNKAHFEEFDR